MSKTQCADKPAFTCLVRPQIVNDDIVEEKKITFQLLRSQRLESLGMLASGIAHDLNNVLTPIMLGVQILQLRFTDENSQQILEVLRLSAERGGEMVRQVLSFAQGIEGPKITLQPIYFVKEILKLLRETLPENITVRHILPPDIGAINGDTTQLHQVLMNLCMNARDAMPEGGVLTIEATNTVIDECEAQMAPDARAGRYVMITVSDTGVGIPEHLRDKIFNQFFTTKEIGKGTGLGLSTVCCIVKSLGGFIKVYSEVGKGTQFKIYLPLVETADTAQAAVTQPVLPRGNSLGDQQNDSIRQCHWAHSQPCLQRRKYPAESRLKHSHGEVFANYLLTLVRAMDAREY